MQLSRRIHCIDNKVFRHFPNDFYLGDQPIVSDGSERQTADEYSKASNKTNELKKRKKTKDGKKRKKKRKKPAREKSLSKSPTSRRLNETVVSQLDISCFAKALGKRLIKAPSIEHAYLAKYARFVLASRLRQFRSKIISRNQF